MKKSWQEDYKHFMGKTNDVIKIEWAAVIAETEHVSQQSIFFITEQRNVEIITWIEMAEKN